MQKLKVLEKLSNQALAEKPDLVAWNETAFAPRIYWHTHYRNDPDTYDVVEELMRYLKPQTVPFLNGTDDGRLEPAETSKGLPGTEYYQVGPSGISAINTPGLITAGSNIYARVDYNAAVMYRGDTESGVYRKIHLVPFTESFPWAKQLPGVYQMIIDAGNYMWKKGTEYTVFDTGKFKFSTPICFEDSFGQPSRGFVQHGAQVIVNITNDAWSNSEAAQMQHAAMAAFRAVENRRSLVRATATGQTCAFDPSGRLLGMAEPFKQVNLIADVPIVKSSDPQGTTFYTLHGDFLPLIFLFFSVLLLIGGLIRFIIKVKVKKDDEQ
jgi:apolipoprotein N-acyltransferase